LVVIKRLYADEEAAAIVEYALMVALIAVASILIVGELGWNVRRTFRIARRVLRR
jgi:Flp pilus assembly pilin Flp